MTRREFLAAAGVGAAGLTAIGRLAMGAATAPAPAGRRPNIVLLLADDLGYADLGCQGCKDVPTPHVDSIAAAGVRFTQGYVSCPVCSPTRAGLLTGRYQQRFGHEFNPGSPKAANENFGLPLSQKTLADRLKALGYATGLVGKWHLGYKPELAPQKRGFDEFFGFPGGSHSYLDAANDPLNPVLRNGQALTQEEYLTDAFAREAVAFIRRHKDQPFFLYLAFNAVHLPLQTVEKYRQRFEGKITDPKRLTYAAMLSAMDDAVGAVLAELRKGGLANDTLVIFLSDNGGPTARTTSRNDPLSGGKSQVLEGGIRIPFLAQWPGHLPAGKVVEAPIISLDILPTAVAAAGGTISAEDPVDGVDLLPFLTGRKGQPPHEKLFWRYGTRWAVRVGDWKLVKHDEGPPRLINLAADIGEKNDLAEQNPRKVEELRGVYDEWNARNIQPLWQGALQQTRPAGAGKVADGGSSE